MELTAVKTVPEARAAALLPESISHEMFGTLRVPQFEDVLRAAHAIVSHIRRTPLLRWPALDARAGGPVWLKLENLQLTGSFKLRGAFNALLNLDPAQRARGVVAYSTGNHGQAIAWAAAQLGIPATIVMPADAPRNKVAKAVAQGARVVHYDRHHESREAIGMQLLAETGAALVPPGDHPHVLAAQGTVALEALEDLPAGVRENLGLFAAPCGGGGLMAGCNLVLAALSPGAQRVAVEPAGYDDTVRSLRSGRRESNDPAARTLCDALQAATPAELPFAINQPLLSSAVAVTDAQVRQAMRFALEELRLVVEPGGSVALAALLAGHLQPGGRGAVVVVSGGNVDLPLLQAVLAQD